MYLLWPIPLVGERGGGGGGGGLFENPSFAIWFTLIGCVKDFRPDLYVIHSLMKHLYLYYELSTPIKVNL
jgi:hypothetical protein